MRPRSALTALVLSAATCALAGTAQAQQNYVPRDLPRGVTTPMGIHTAGDYDASAVAGNPGGLGTIRGPNLVLATTIMDTSRSLVGGGGWGLFLSFPLIKLPVEDSELRLGYGFGFQATEAPDAWVGPVSGSQDVNLLQNSTFVGTDTWSLGWTISTLWWDETPQSDATVLTHHVGLALRPSRYLALGGTIRDVFEPAGRAAEERLGRSYDVDAAIRPLGDWRFELSGGATIGEDELVDVRGRAIVRPLPGVAVFGHVESIERPFGIGSPSASRDTRALFGLTIDSIDGLLGRSDPAFSVSYAALASSKSDRSYAGSTIAVRISSERYPSVVERRRVERVDLSRAMSDRDFVRQLLYLRSLEDGRGLAGVILVVAANGWAWGRTDELRAAIARLRAAGKRVIAYLPGGDIRTYYATAGADHVVVHPTAVMSLTGVATAKIYLAELLDKAGIGAQVVRIADYKTAPEQLTRTSPSRADREQWGELLRDTSERFARRIAADRKLEPEQVRAILARPALTPDEAESLGLIDGAAHPDELEPRAEKVFGGLVNITTPRDRPSHPTQWVTPAIAVIHIDGDIIPGESGGLLGTQPGGERIARAIRRARESADIEAIVLRVNSPGGAVQPSERIAREVELTRGEKPIVVSMGDVAASGGYMVSAHGERVFASPSTITGSIGIFGIKLHIEDMLAKIGVSTTTLKVGEHADQDSAFRPWSETELTSRRAVLAHLYDRFVDLVSQARDMPKKRTLAVAGGRVWSGRAARGIGLVDDLRGFLGAVDDAQRRAGLSGVSMRFVHWPRDRAPLAARLLGVSRVELPKPLAALVARIPAIVWTGGGTLYRAEWTLSR